MFASSSINGVKMINEQNWAENKSRIAYRLSEESEKNSVKGTFTGNPEMKRILI
jgi:hypothetical protein